MTFKEKLLTKGDKLENSELFNTFNYALRETLSKKDYNGAKEVIEKYQSLTEKKEKSNEKGKRSKKSTKKTD
jgi:translation elongation factor EF-Tu-like GTPase